MSVITPFASLFVFNIDLFQFETWEKRAALAHADGMAFCLTALVDSNGEGLCYNVPERNEVMQMREETIERVRRFVTDREWEQFHTPANMAKSISIEANELLECFQWDEEHYNLDDVKDELADVLVYCIDMLDKLNLDADEIIKAKMTKNELKYPIEKARGNNKKYRS